MIIIIICFHFSDKYLEKKDKRKKRELGLLNSKKIGSTFSSLQQK